MQGGRALPVKKGGRVKPSRANPPTTQLVTATKKMDYLENPEYISSLSDDPDEWMLDEVTLECLVQNGMKQNIDADFSFF